MNNKTASGRISTIFSITWLMIAIIIAFSLFFDFGFGYMIPIVLGVLLILLILFYVIGGFCYIEVEVKNSSLYIKYYNLFPIRRKYEMCQIPLNHLSDIKVKKYALSSFLHIYEKTKKGVARYPSIGISAMSISQRKQMITYLKSLIIL